MNLSAMIAPTSSNTSSKPQALQRTPNRSSQQSGYNTANAAQQLIQQETATALANLAAAAVTDRQTIADLRDLVDTLKKQIAEQTTELTRLRGNSTKPQQPDTRKFKNPPPFMKDCGSYCWTHGYRVRHDHNSANCRNPGIGHKKEATRENNMGGNPDGKQS